MFNGLCGCFQVKIDLKSVDFVVSIKRENVVPFLKRENVESLPMDCTVCLRVRSLLLVHHGMGPFDVEDGASPPHRRWLRYLSGLSAVDALSGMTTCFDVDCQSVWVSVGGDANTLNVEGLSIEYKTDVLSLWMSPFVGYQLSNAMALRPEHTRFSRGYPAISVDALSVDLCCDDVLSHCTESAVLAMYFVDILGTASCGGPSASTYPQTQNDGTSSPLMVAAKCQSIALRLSLLNPFASTSLLKEREFPLVDLVCSGVAATILVSARSLDRGTQSDAPMMNDEALHRLFGEEEMTQFIYSQKVMAMATHHDAVTVSFVVTMASLALDVPSIFESAASYKHPLGALPAAHRLLTFESVAVGGMSCDDGFCSNHCPTMLSVDTVLVQYHPAMTECVAPIVCMLSHCPLAIHSLSLFLALSLSPNTLSIPNDIEDSKYWTFWTLQPQCSGQWLCWLSLCRRRRGRHRPSHRLLTAGPLTTMSPPL